MKHLISISILLVVFVTSSCKKEDVPPETTTTPPYVPSAQELEFLDFWWFPDGSYWVYSDTVNNLIDTVTILDRDIDYDYSYAPSEFEGTKYTLLLNHTCHEVYGNSNYEVLVGGYRPESGNFGLIQNFHESNVPTGVYIFGMYDNYMVFHYPYSLGDTVHLNTNIISTNNLTTELGTFDNTVGVEVFVKSWYELETANYIAHLYLSKGVGTTKTVTGLGYSLELIDFHLE